MLRLRPFAFFICLVVALCLLGLWGARSQTGGLRRVTNTTEEGININPSLSGDGRRIAFESTEDLAHAGGSDRFRAIRADLSSDPAVFTQMAAARAPAPGISQDGSRIAFAAKEDPLGTNLDGNSEIFLYDGATLRQITNTTPNDISTRTRDGNFQPSLTDDGRFIAFSSNRNLSSQNADGNLEVFIYDINTNTFTQLTNTTGAVGASDAKISGDGTRVAYIRDNNASPSTQRDLILQDRTGGTTRLIASNVLNLAFTYGRAISDDGLRIVYSADVATDSSQVFLYDGRTSNTTRQVTALGVRTTEVPLHPTISGDGTRIAFATRRPITGFSNTDNSIELYTYDIPTGQFARVTNAPSTADEFDGSTRVGEVVSSLNDDGSIVAFNFPRSLSGAVTSGLENNSEIYVTATAPRPTVGTLTVLNGASFGNEPSTTKAIAPDSYAVALGGALSFTTEQSAKQADGTFPTTVGGTTVTVNGRRAQIFFVSPTQVNFLVPRETELGTATVIITNSEGFQSRGTVTVLRAAPGIFTTSGDGTGEAVVLNAQTGTPGPFDPTNGNLRLVIFATGVRNASQVSVTAGGRALTVESVMASADMPGFDEVRVLVPSDLRGVGTVDLVIRADNRDSNPATIIFSGTPRNDIVINEVLADPPDGLAGDANHDGVRSSSDDEFVEIVNATARDIDISGYTLSTRSTGGASDTVRHTFAPGTIFPAGSAIVVFGGGNFNPNDPVFGGALVLKASSGGLSLTNAGGVVTLRDTSQSIVNIFSYGGSTGLNGDANQSLTRSPDITGGFAPHTTAQGSNGRAFSPGTRVDGSPFATVAIARIDVTPPSATIDNGAKQQFTAQAFDANNQPISGVIFTWQSSNTAVATIDQNGLATSLSPGTTEIRASARGVTSAPATLTVRDVQRILTRVDVTPPSATIPVSGAQQFTAHGFDQFNNEIAGLTFTWESTDTTVATIDANGLATGVHQGTTTIRATSGGVTGTATLNVTPPTVLINEVLADPAGSTATDLQGDANHDGTRSASDDEFVELVNSASASINISGWKILTRSTGGTTDTLRHTFATGTTLPAGEAIVVFGGGNPNPSDGVFACAQVVRASSGGLSLTNGGLTVIVQDANGNLITQFSYGGSTGLNGDNDQSLTRSPDITGNFVLHTAATGAGGRRFSPGTRVDGSPFGSCPARLTSVTISPPSASITAGQSTQFTAQAFDQFGHAMTGVTITFVSDNTSAATVDSVTTDPGTGIATATVTGHNPGTAHITAQATDGTTTVTSSQATLTVNSATITYSVSGQVRDAGNNPLSGVLITFEMDFQGTLTTKTTLTDANGNYSSGDLGCQNRVRVTPSKTGLTFTPSAISFVTSSGCLSGNDAANFTGAPPPPGTLVISQLYVGGGNSGATYTNDFVEIFNSGTTTVDFSQTPYSIQYVGTTGSFGSTSASNKTNITSGTIAPGQYFLVQEASGGAAGIALPTPDATGSINMAAAGGKVALVVGTAALPAFTCPGDDGASPFNPSNPTIADFVGYGSSATTVGHCYEGPGPAAAPSATNADFRKGGGCVDTNFNADDFLTASVNPRNTSSPLNDCSAGIKPEMTINDPASVSESAANATFTVTLSTPSTLTVTVNYATSDGTATAGADYQSTSGTLTFAPGETTKSILVPIINDTMDEPSETFFVNLTNASNAVILDNQGQGTITDNDAAPTISINDTSVTEGDSGTTNATFTVTLSAASGFTVTVNYATADGTAAAGSDYQSTSGTVTFNPGQTTQTILVPVNGDTTFEPNETFFVNLTTPTNATILDNQGQGTITNDDAAPPLPAISINDVSVAEGNSGTKTVSFTVSLSMTSTDTITVNYATANGTATAGSDYQSTSGTVTFSSGQTSQTISVTINGDTLVEPDETFFVNLTNASANAVITDGQGQGTITNDDAANLVISQIYPGGGLTNATYKNDFIEIFNRGTTTVDFSVTPYSVQFLSTGGSAWVKTDLTSGSVAPGQYFLIQETSGGSVGATLPTPDATGSINLTSTTPGKVALVLGTTLLTGNCPGDDGATPFNPVGFVDFVGYGGSSSTANHCYEGAGPASFTTSNNTIADFRKAGGCTDTDNNAADFLIATPSPRNTGSPLNSCSAGVTPNLTINDVTVVEGNAGTATATFTVSLSAPAQGADVTFDIATADGTATVANNDYVARSLTNQIIPAGQQTYTFTVNINGDTAVEPDETFFVNVTNVAGANLTDGQGVGTIQNDDLPSLSINDVTQNEGNAGTTTFTFTVHLSAPAPAGVSFDIATADGTAQDGNPAGEDTDYVARSLTAQTIPAGQQDYSFAVTVNGDTNVEPNETFFVNVTNVSGVMVADAQGQGTILNDDSPTLTINDVSLNEGNSGTTTFTFTVNLSQPAPVGGVTFDIATQDGTATVANNDYVARSLTGQTIPEGQQTFTFDVTVNGDTVVEPNETFFVNLTNASGATIGDNQGIGTILNDDTSNLVISQVYGGGNNTGAQFRNDFIEIFNRGTTAVDFSVTPYSIQYSSGTTWAKTDITAGTIAPGHYFLIQEAGGTTNGVALPTPDATGTINLTASSPAKVALVLGTTLLSASSCPGDDGTPPFNPNSATVIDLVGYGGTAATADHCYEGAGPAPALTNTTADFRRAGGCTDTNDNAADFLVSAPNPRNTGSPVNSCSAGPTPNLTINDVTIAEGDAGTKTATFTVSLSAPAPSTDVTFDISTQDNTATTANSDYVARSLTNQVIPAGQQTYTFSVTINGDTTVEADETFFVNVTNVAGANVTDGQGMGTIQNDDLPTLSINDVTQSEGNGGATTFTFTVSLSAPAPTGGVTFDIATADGTAQDGTPSGEDNDYVAKNLTSQTIAAGSQTYTFDVTVNGDTNIEPNETFLVNVTNVSGATVSDGQGLGTIQNDDSPPTLSISDVTQAEGNSATTTTFTFTVSLTSPAPAGGVTFDIATQDDTAVAGSDYVARSLTSQTIPAGSQTYTFDVTVNGDNVFEPNETFFVNVANVSGATVTDGQGVGTITNDDAQPTITITDASVIEGNSGTSLMTFTVTLNGTSQSTVSVDYATADSSATVADSDYDSASGTLNFASGDTSKTFTVTIHGDTNAEGDEMFLVNLSGASGATISDNQALGTIFLDDPFSIAALNTTYSENFDVLAQSGVSSTTPTAWTRAESGTSANTTYTANNGSSTTGDTYSYGTTGASDRALGGLRTGSLVPTFGAFYRNDTGATINTLQINYTGEEWRLGTAGRTDRLDFQYSTDATSLTTGTWVDVDALDFTTPNTTTTGSKDGNNAANRTAISNTITGLSLAPGATVWVRWTDLDASGADDGLAVDDFSITAGVNTPALSINDVTAAEGNAGMTTFNFTVSLTSPAPPGGVSFTINTADGTTNPATAGSDYVAITGGSGSIAQNNTSTTVSVTVNGDTAVESDETFFVNISNVSGATVTDGQGVGTITNDDAVAATADLSVTKTDAPDPVLPGNTLTYTLNVANGGPGTATSVSVTDNLPSSVTFVNCSSTGGGSCSNIGNNVTVSFTSLANGATATITLTATVNSGTGGTTITNTANITSATSDPQSSNDTAVSTTNVARAPNANELIINEVLANPNSDANRDGTASTSSNQLDEFVEIYNSTNVALDLSGLNLFDSTTTLRHTFPANTLLQPGKAIVIFGGESGTATASNIPGIPSGVSSKTTTAPNASFGGAIVQVASSYNFGNVSTSGLGLNNTGSPTADTVRIFNGNTTGTLLASASFPAPTADKSFTRTDVETGPNRNFVSGDLHPQVTNAASVYLNRFYSPGFKTDGVTPF